MNRLSDSPTRGGVDQSKTTANIRHSRDGGNPVFSDLGPLTSHLFFCTMLGTTDWLAQQCLYREAGNVA
jgi:hypothetical protein